MYKALFELSADRADFVSRLFSRQPPAGLRRATATRDLQTRSRGQSERTVLDETLAAIRNQLITVHHLALSGDDLEGIEYVYRASILGRARIQYSPVGISGGSVQPTYAELMKANDMAGQARGYLATEQAFALPEGSATPQRCSCRSSAISPARRRSARSAAITAQHDASVSAFYVSNVEEYLRQDGLWLKFCANVASLPLAAGSPFIRAVRATEPGLPNEGFVMRLDPIAPEVRGAPSARNSSRHRTYISSRGNTNRPATSSMMLTWQV